MSRIEAGALQLKRRWNVLAEIAARGRQAGAPVQPGPPHRTGHPRRPAAGLRGRCPDGAGLQQPAQQQPEIFARPARSSRSRPASRMGRPSGCRWTTRVRPSREADLEKIFEKFHRVTAADQITGTGLGLSICKGIVEAHQGRIWAENLEQGFAIQLHPAHPCRRATAPRIPEANEQPAPHPRHRRRTPDPARPAHHPDRPPVPRLHRRQRRGRPGPGGRQPAGCHHPRPEPARHGRRDRLPAPARVDAHPDHRAFGARQRTGQGPGAGCRRR